MSAINQDWGTTMRKELERELAHKTYEQIDQALRNLSDGELLDLFDSPSIKVGDSACDILWSRSDAKFEDEMVDALLDGRFKTRLGRMRASQVVICGGKRVRRAHEAYLHLLHDRSTDVVDNAIFGLVFLNDKAHLPAVEAARDALPDDSKMKVRFASAIKALQAGNPFFFSSGYNDAANAWGLKDSPLKAAAVAAEDADRRPARPTP
ncbi:MAG TPA: hypothetical protein VHY91_16170 [Pirellulales bacterium]|jgi:hypothetical protein|nr:hypothetical protein [Pirellulales bacterium]HEX4145043.1 hypothetical protein [Pirellulales bacterium]